MAYSIIINYSLWVKEAYFTASTSDFPATVIKTSNPDSEIIVYEYFSHFYLDSDTTREHGVPGILDPPLKGQVKSLQASMRNTFGSEDLLQEVFF